MSSPPMKRFKSSQNHPLFTEHSDLESNIVINPSLPKDSDEYDTLGRNISAQQRRERMFGKWIRVTYKNK